MEKFSDRIKDWQTTANDNEALIPPENAGTIAEILTRAKARAETALGEVIDPEIADLPPGTLGDCHSQTGTIRLAADSIPVSPEDIAPAQTRVVLPDEKKLTHAMIHEGTHRMRFAASNDNLPEETEEGLTELATEEDTGNTMAYAEYVSNTRAMAARVGLPIGTLTTDYKTGNIKHINAALAADANGMTFTEYQKHVAENDNEPYALAA